MKSPGRRSSRSLPCSPAWRGATAGKRWVLAGACVALCLHFFFGKFGWLHRYEISLLFGLVIIFRVAAPTVGNAFFYGCGVLLFAFQLYFPDTFAIPLASQNIYDQQYQMHRFVAGYYKKNVAVNDLGWVSYERGPGIYVLDLYGLASNEALKQSVHDAPWLERIAHQHDVGLVMIYPSWFPEIPADWTPVATLSMNTHLVSSAQNRVQIYSTPDGNREEIRNELKAFAPKFPTMPRWNSSLDLMERCRLPIHIPIKSSAN